MPGNLLTADTGLPDLSGKGSTEEKLKAVSGYLYMLLEQLRYTLSNLGQDNFNEAELDSIGKLITGPLTVRVEETEQGVTQLTITVDGVKSSVRNLDGRFSVVEQTVDGLSVETEGGTTYITGDHVKSGTIEGSTLKCTLKNGRDESDGQLNFYYNGRLCGQINLNTQGSAEEEGKYRMFVSTFGNFGLKLQAESNTSYQSQNGGVYISAPKGEMILSAGAKVRIASPNGTQYEFRDDGIYYNASRIVDNTAAV